MGIFSRTVAAIMLIILSPLLLLISICSLLFQGLPIIFKQERVGFKFGYFYVYKFRTMNINNDNLFITVAGDSRITPWGKILRFFKLDELPQLWNIAKGDMRFIGPRPEIPKYCSQTNFYFLNDIYPGLSDYSSILLRNENVILRKIGGNKPYETLLKLKIDLAVLYFKHKSFWLNFKLTILTFIAIIIPNIATRIILNFTISKKLPKWYDFVYTTIYK